MLIFTNSPSRVEHCSTSQNHSCTPNLYNQTKSRLISFCEQFGKAAVCVQGNLLYLEHTGEDGFEDESGDVEENEGDEDEEDQNDGEEIRGLCDAKREKELALMIATLDSFGLPPNDRPHRDQWINELTYRKELGLFALLIMSLLNLEVLHLQTNSNTLGA